MCSLGSKISFGILPLIFAGLIGCGEGSDSGSKARGAAYLGSLKPKDVSAMGHVEGDFRKLSPMSLSPLTTTNPSWDEAIPSSNKYAFAKVDGIKLVVKDIWASEKNGNRRQFAVLNKVLELRNDTSSVNIEAALEVPVGSYKELGVSLENKVSIKAFCQVEGQKIYTTKNGVKLCDATVDGCEDSDSLPSDYDYLENPFLVIRANEKPGEPVGEGYKMDFEIKETDTPQFSLLVDTSYITTCALHSADIDNHTRADGILAPFSWTVEAPKKKSDYYKGAVGYFGVAYIPIFTHVTNSKDAVLPTGETYVASSQSSHIPNGVNDFNFLEALITTIAFDSNGEILAARSRNFDADHGTDLEQGWSGFEKKSDGTYVMLNGEHWMGAKPDYSEARWLQDRKIEGFKRDDFKKTFSVQVTNGPECSKGLGEKNRECLNSPIQTYWKQVPR